MSTIRDISNPWRDRYRTASFRGAIFHIEIGARNGGRRVAPHAYPKRNTGYAEDMGRRARRFSIQGYLIGPNYLDLRDRLITALEGEGPGTLRMSLPYQGEDIEVMCLNYTVTETRERGGLCGVDMDFMEAGKPGFSNVVTSTLSQISSVAANLEATTLNRIANEVVPRLTQ